MAKITPNQAIRNAIEAELAAARFYTLLAESTNDLASRAFLEDMADNERAHARQIREIGETLVSGPLAARADSDMALVETLPEWRFADDLGMRQALEVALSAEEKAAAYYDALADFLDEPVKGLFLDLARTEEAHATALRAKQRTLGFAHG
jgi:rubrerythrin